MSISAWHFATLCRYSRLFKNSLGTSSAAPTCSVLQRTDILLDFCSLPTTDELVLVTLSHDLAPILTPGVLFNFYGVRWNMQMKTVL